MLDDSQEMEMGTQNKTKSSVDEIFNNIASHMQKGLGVHEQLTNYYNFLGMDGFAEDHEHHYDEEAHNLQNLNRYYIEHYDKILNPVKGEVPSIIPASWYKHTRNDVDPTTKRNGVEKGLKEWHNWEDETKHEYERYYKQLMDMDETSAAFFVKDLIDSADEELKEISKTARKLKDEEFNLRYVNDMQDKMREKYRRNQNSGSRNAYDQSESEYRRPQRYSWDSYRSRQ